MNDQSVGRVVGGGFSSNLKIKLNVPVEEVRVGDYLTIAGRGGIYYAAVVDISYGPADQQLVGEDWAELSRPELADYANEELLSSMAEAGLMMVLPNQTSSEKPIQPGVATTIPPQRASVHFASSSDMSGIFGLADETHMILGHTRNQGHPILINLERLIQRSTGLFGATGTGKSFLVRELLAGLLKKGLASILVLDMHNEYSYPDTDENGNQILNLADLFPHTVKVFGLGPNTRIRGHVPPNILRIGYNDITTEDVLLMWDELDLTDTASHVLDALVRSFGEHGWLAAFARMENTANASEDRSVDAWAKKAGVHIQAARALRRRVNRILNCSYVVDQQGWDSIQEIVRLLEAGQSVILGFGKHNRALDHILVGNVISRLIGTRWQDLADIFRSTGENPPRHLLVVVEEAHKFLFPKVVNQTVFGRLAREMRKSFCTLLVIDQMPQKISPLVTSQIGTRFVTWLGDEEDVKAVTAGLPNRENLRRMIASLAQNQEAVIMGWGMPMPIAIRICNYDMEFLESL